MDWTIAILAIVVIAAFYLFKRMNFVAEAEAREQLAKGALVIDVRSPEEFRGDNVPGAINLPLDGFSESILQRVPDRNQPLLVHCLSGGRSAIAKHQLQNLGYTKVFNLGSLGRAKQIVAAPQKD